MVTTEGRRQKKERGWNSKAGITDGDRQETPRHKGRKKQRKGDRGPERTGSRKDIRTLDAYTEMEERNKKTRKMRE